MLTKVGVAGIISSKLQIGLKVSDASLLQESLAFLFLLFNFLLLFNGLKTFPIHYLITH